MKLLVGIWAAAAGGRGVASGEGDEETTQGHTHIDPAGQKLVHVANYLIQRCSGTDYSVV